MLQYFAPTSRVLFSGGIAINPLFSYFFPRRLPAWICFLASLEQFKQFKKLITKRPSGKGQKNNNLNIVIIVILVLDLLKNPRKNEKYFPKGTLVRPKIKNHLKQNQVVIMIINSPEIRHTRAFLKLPSRPKRPFYGPACGLGVFEGLVCQHQLALSVLFRGGAERRKRWCGLDASRSLEENIRISLLKVV